MAPPAFAMTPLGPAASPLVLLTSTTMRSFQSGEPASSPPAARKPTTRSWGAAATPLEQVLWKTSERLGLSLVLVSALILMGQGVMPFAVNCGSFAHCWHQTWYFKKVKIKMFLISLE